MPRPRLAIGTYGKINLFGIDAEGHRVELKKDRRGRWVPVVPCRWTWAAETQYRDDNGSTRTVQARATSRSRAEAALKAKLLEKMAKAGSDMTLDTSVAALGRYWLETQVDPMQKLARSTKDRYRYEVESHIIPALGDLTIREATTARLDRFLMRMREERGPESAKVARSCLSGMMGLAARYDVIPQNVIRDTTKIETSTPEPKALSVEEARKLRHDLRRDKWAVNGDLPDYAAMVLATGCRAGEVLAIRWEDIDLDAGTVEVNGKIIRHTGVGLVRETTKGRKTTKMLLPDWAVEMLRDRQARDLPSGPLGLVFATATGNPREVRTVDRQMQRFRQRHPEWGDDLVPKKLRKTVATAVERNRGLSAASRQLSHSSQETTAGHYVQRPDIGPDNRAVLDQFAIESGGGK